MLSNSAQKIIQNYLSLPFKYKPGIKCPYFNNRVSKIRGGLNAHIGKGTPEDIVEEAMIFALKEKIDLNNLTAEETRKFLTDHRLGVDCSGFAYYILDAESKAQGKGALKKHLKFPFAKGLWRKILTRLRPMAHAGVSTFAHDLNSTTINLKDIQPGDIIIFLNAGEEHKYNHLLVVTDTQKNSAGQIIIKYAHSIQYKNDTLGEHGVREGEIILENPNDDFLKQKFVEQKKENGENKLFQYAKTAQKIEIRRLKIFNI